MIYAEYGWLSESEATMLGSLAERRLALERAAAAGGRTHRSAMHRFQAVAVRLAYLRHRIDRGTAPWDAQHREVELLRQLESERRANRDEDPDS